MPKADTARAARIRALIAAGKSSAAIARIECCSRGLVGHYRRAVAKVKARQMPAGGPVDALKLLEERAKEGSIQATVALARIQTAGAESCRDHVPQAEADKWAVRIFEVMRTQVQLAAAQPEFADVRAALDDANIDAFELAKEQLDREIGPQSE